MRNSKILTILLAGFMAVEPFSNVVMAEGNTTAKIASETESTDTTPEPSTAPTETADSSDDELIDVEAPSSTSDAVDYVDVVQGVVDSYGSSSSSEQLQDVSGSSYTVSADDSSDSADITEPVALDFSSGRLLVATEDESILANEPVISSYNGVYMLQYETSNEASEAYDRLESKADFIQPDIEFTAAEGDVAPEDVPEPDDTQVQDAMEAGSTPLDAVADATETTEVAPAKGKVIYLIDSGTDEDSHVIERVSMIGDDVGDASGHGTSMLGYIVDENPNAKVVSVKVLDTAGKGTASAIYAGIEYAVANGADIISLSLAAFSTQENSVITSAVYDAINNGAIVVAAAGNNGKNAAYFTPANIKGVRTIGAAQNDGTRQPFSNYGEIVSILGVADSTSEAAARYSGAYSKHGEVDVSAEGTFGFYPAHISAVSDAPNPMHISLNDNGQPEVTDFDLGWDYNKDSDTLTLQHGFTFTADTEIKCKVVNYGTIVGGQFSGDVTNYGSITGGEFTGKVTNDTTRYTYTLNGKSDEEIRLAGTVEGGTFDEYPDEVTTQWSEDFNADGEFQAAHTDIEYRTRRSAHTEQRSVSHTGTRSVHWSNTGTCAENQPYTSCSTSTWNGQVVSSGTRDESYSYTTTETVNVPAGAWGAWQYCNKYNSCPAAPSGYDLETRANGDLLSYSLWGTVSDFNQVLSDNGINRASITSVQWYNGTPDASVQTAGHDVSTPNSKNRIYVWYDNGTLYYWCQDGTTYLNSNSSDMFSGMTSMKTFDGTHMDTSLVNNMTRMFYNDTAWKDINLATWDTRNVTNMYWMFAPGNSYDTMTLGENWRFTTAGGGPYLNVPVVKVGEETDQATGLTRWWTATELVTYYHQTEQKYNKVYLGPGTYARYTGVDHAYVGNGNGQYNMWEIHHPESPFKGYCFSHHIGGPSGLYDRIEATETIVNSSDIFDNPNKKTGPGMTLRESMIAVLYYGYPNNGGGLKEKYGLTDLEFMVATHYAVWYYSDGNTGGAYATGLWGVNARDPKAIQNCYHELLSKQYSSIPNASNYKLYIYLSREGHQNTLGMESLQPTSYGGIEVRKEDTSGNGLPGAKFAIYNASGAEVARITTDDTGYAYLCKTDKVNGLTMGTYTVREVEAPYGYNLSSDVYTVNLTANGEIVKVGYKNGASDPSLIKFIDTNNGDPEYTRIKITKRDAATGKGVNLAVYDIINASGTVVDTLTTSAVISNGSITDNGVAVSKRLPVGTYTIKEKSAPEGYTIDATAYTVNGVNVKGTSNTVNLTVTDNPLYGSATIEVHKTVYRYKSDGSQEKLTKLVPNSYQFGLYRIIRKNPSTGVVETTLEATAYNDADGNVTFNRTYSTNDGFDVEYQIKEISAPYGVVNDTRTEYASVVMAVNTAGNGLDTVVSYTNGDDNSQSIPEFTNYQKRQDISGNAWLDVNENGVWDDGDTYAEGITVQLMRTTRSGFGGSAVQVESKTLYPAYNREGELLNPITTTLDNGYYEFDNVEDGTYYLVVKNNDLPYDVTAKQQGSDPAKMSLADGFYNTESNGDKTLTWIEVGPITPVDWSALNGYHMTNNQNIGVKYAIPLVEPGVKGVYDADGVDINTKFEKRNSNLYYTITFFNHVHRNYDFTIEDMLPAGTSFVSADNGGTYDPTTGMIKWTVTRYYGQHTVSFVAKIEKNGLQIDNHADIWTMVGHKENRITTNTVTNYSAGLIINKSLDRGNLPKIPDSLLPKMFTYTITDVSTGKKWTAVLPMNGLTGSVEVDLPHDGQYTITEDPDPNYRFLRADGSNGVSLTDDKAGFTVTTDNKMFTVNYTNKINKALPKIKINVENYFG